MISAPLAAPVIAASRLRGGKANSARGAASLAAEAISAARAAGRTGQLLFRVELGVLLRRGGGHDPCRRGVLLVTVRMDPKIRAAIAAIPDQRGRRSPTRGAVWDEDQDRLISDAEVAGGPAPRSPRRNARRSPPG